VDRALFVPCQDVAQARAHLLELIIDVQYGPAGIAEDGVHALIDQCFQKDSGATDGLLAIRGSLGAINFIHEHEISPKNAKAVIFFDDGLDFFCAYQAVILYSPEW